MSGDFKEFLRTHHACGEDIEWVSDRDLVTAWMECENAGWMIWLLDEIGAPSGVLSEIAIRCAERVLPIYESEYPGDSRPHTALISARRYLTSEISRQELRAAAHATVYAARYVAHAAADAAYAIVYAIHAAAHAARNAATAAEHAAHAAGNAAGVAAHAAGYLAERQEQADIIRAVVSVEDVQMWYAEATRNMHEIISPDVRSI